MIKTSTLNEIVRYVYEETSEEESRKIESEMICNTELLDIYNEFGGIKNRLNKIAKKPSERAVENILQYSKFLTLHSVK